MTKKNTTAVAQLIEKGGQVTSDRVDREALMAAASEQQLAFFDVPCGRARNSSAVLRAIVKALDYPSFLGSDSDALIDCLHETLADQKKGMVLWLHELHSADEALQDFAQRLEVILRDAAEFAPSKNRVFIYYVEHVGPHEAPEPGHAPARYGES